MTVFFFVVGLEIKQAVLWGELAERKKAIFPIAAALGGMLLPALIFVSLNLGQQSLRGWGIPMATDIAFAMVMLALLGHRAPPQLRLFLLTLAIIDDIGAILVIGVFYTQGFSWTAVASAVAILFMILMFVRAGIRSLPLHLILAFSLWAAMLKSGVHATLTGIILAMATPSVSWFTQRHFSEAATGLVERITMATGRNNHNEAEGWLGQMEELIVGTEAPLSGVSDWFTPGSAMWSCRCLHSAMPA